MTDTNDLAAQVAYALIVAKGDPEGAGELLCDCEADMDRLEACIAAIEAGRDLNVSVQRAVAESRAPQNPPHQESKNGSKEADQ